MALVFPACVSRIPVCVIRPKVLATLVASTPLLHGTVDLINQRGAAMGAEFKEQGPAMNLAQTAAAGRNWEGFGADPYLSGEAAFQTITVGNYKRQGISTMDEAVAYATPAVTNHDPNFQLQQTTLARTSPLHSSAAKPDAPHKLPARHKITPVTTDVPLDMLSEAIVGVAKTPTDTRSCVSEEACGVDAYQDPPHPPTTVGDRRLADLGIGSGGGGNGSTSPASEEKEGRRSLYSRPGHDGDSELDENDGVVEEEEVMGNVQCEEGEEGPSSFLFSIPGIHTKAMVEEARRKVSTVAGGAAEAENSAEDVAAVSAEDDGMETAGEVEPEAESSGASSSGSFSSGLTPLYEEIVDRRDQRVLFFVERAFDEGDSSELGGTFRLKKLCDCPTSSSSSSTSSYGSESLYVRDVLRHPNSSSSDDDDDEDDDYICTGVEGVAMPTLLLTSPPVERAKMCVNVAELSGVLAKMAWPPQMAVMRDNGRRVGVDGENAGIVAGVS
ncbi:hypothetical protein FRB99_007571 [Tulasnella sp. 403]|nr:hypothetical protein FRB99_007571 [Tulasnella sp. 403]